jgi:DNA polymerase-3 subunit beta
VNGGLSNVVFTVDTARLRPALQALMAIGAHRDALPILSGLLVQTDGADTVWTAYNQNIGIEVTVPANVEIAGAGVLPGRPVADLVRRLEQGELRVDTEGGEATRLAWTGAHATIPLFRADDFPRPGFSASPKHSVPGDELRRGFEHVAYAAARDQARGSALEGLQLTFGDDHIECEATDQIRLAWSRRPASGGGAIERVIVPVSGLSTLIRLAPQEPSYRFAADERGITFFWPDTRLHCRLLSGALPDAARLVPAEFSCQAVTGRAALMAACERVAVLAGSATTQVRILWTASEARLSAEDVGHRAEEVVPCKTVGDDLTIAFNAQYLVDALAHLEGEEVLVELTGPERPARLRPVDSRDHFALVSPMIAPR